MLLRTGKYNCVLHLVNISDARVARLGLAVLVQRLHHLPAPLPVLGVLRQPPHQEVGLHGLRAQDVISEQNIVIYYRYITSCAHKCWQSHSCPRLDNLITGNGRKK